MGEAQKQADIQRAEAKRLFNLILGPGGNTPNTGADAVVDCIIGAAILEIAAIQQEATKPKGDRNAIAYLEPQ